jgi:hypothetical protein
MHATIEELLGEVFSRRSVPRLHKEWVRVEWSWAELSWEFGIWKSVSSTWELHWDRRQPARTWRHEHGIWRIYGVGSRYQTTTGEDAAEWKNLVCAVVRRWVYELARALYLVVVTICKCSVNAITSPTPVSSHSTESWQYYSVLDMDGPWGRTVIVWNMSGYLSDLSTWCGLL